MLAQNRKFTSRAVTDGFCTVACVRPKSWNIDRSATTGQAIATMPKSDGDRIRASTITETTWQAAAITCEAPVMTVPRRTLRP